MAMRDHPAWFAAASLTALLTALLTTSGCRGETDAPLTGMLAREGETFVFSPCHTRTRVPVALGGDHAALAAAFAEWPDVPADLLLVTVVGRIAVPPPDRATTKGPETPHLLVASFTGIWPGETCGQPHATAQLQDMYWRLTRLEGRPVRVREGGREPHLVLHGADRRLAGSTGCNQLDGTYEHDGESMSFGPIATTKMMCPDLHEQEQAMLQALARVVSWRLDGQHLELLDEGGVVLLRLEERALH